MGAFPAAVATSADAPTVEPYSTLDALRRDLVLLVEDNDVVASLITRVLQQQGWQIVRARDGASCTAEFARIRERISLVVLDWRLPDTDGGTLCQRLRALLPGLPVMLTSGRDHSGMVDDLEHGGPTAFLPKPFYPQDIKRQVAALVGAIG